MTIYNNSINAPTPFSPANGGTGSNLTATTNTILKGNGTDFVNQSILGAQIRYVDPDGSDVNGDGSILFPFASIGHTLTSITDSTSTKPYVVSINPGTYSETGLEVPVWVFLVGSYQQPTKIIDSSGSIKINSASFSAGSERIGFENLNLINSTGITIDFQAIGGAGSNQVYMNNNQVVGPVIMRGRGSDALTGFDNRFFGTYTSSAMQEVHYSGYFANTVLFNTLGVTSVATSPAFTAMAFFGNATFTSSGAGNTMTPTLIACQSSGSLTVDQATTTLSGDDVSLNASPLSITNSGVVTYLSVAQYEGYTPATPGNWSPVPTQVAGALDTLSSSGASGPFTAGSIIFSNGTKLTQDNANLFWDETNKTLEIAQPSIAGSPVPVVTITSDVTGSHGHGLHLEINGNPGGGGTIYRTDGGLNDSWLQLYGGDSSGTNSGGLYINGNNSTGGDAGGVQTTFGLTSSSFQMYDNTQSVLLFQLNNSGVLQLPKLTANSYIGTDGSSNIVVKTSPVFTWTSAAASGAIVANNGYFTTGGSQVVMTLPATAAEGATFTISNTSAAGFQIAQNAGQSIRLGIDATTVGVTGSLTSTQLGDTVTIVCSIANTNFQVISCVGNITII